MGDTLNAMPRFRDFMESWELFRDPVITGMMAGALLGYLGLYIVLRRMVFVAAAISQAAALGVALTFLAQMHGVLTEAVDPVAGALVCALLAMGMFSLNPERLRLTREGLLGLGYLVGAAGTVLVSDRITAEAHDISSILFGPGVVVHPIDVYLTGVATVVFLSLHLWWVRGLVMVSFDEESARVQGLPVRWLNGFLFISIGVGVAVATHAIGALSSFAFSVLPAMTALALSHRWRVVMFLAPLLGMLAGGGGYLFAFFLRFPVGGSQTFLGCLFCVVALVLGAVRKRS